MKFVSSVSKGSTYELFIKDIVYSINNNKNYKLIELAQKKDIIGESGITNNIDVYWNFKIGK